MTTTTTTTMILLKVEVILQFLDKVRVEEGDSMVEEALAKKTERRHAGGQR